jgi:hypothetical protein
VPAGAPVADLLAWCFHSPRRLLLVAAVVVAVVLGGVVAAQALWPGRAGEPGPRASGVEAPAGSEPAVAAAVEFARRWASVPQGQDARQWRAGLAGLVTPELARGLAETDPAGLPGGAPDGQPVLRFVSVSSALVEVPLSGGHRVLVTVVLADRRWLASDVQPVEGNVGDVPAGSASVAASAPPGPSGG